jgi:hypothetical protein
MVRLQTDSSGPFDFPVYNLNLQLQIGVCQYPRKTLTFVYIYTYDNHTLSNYAQLKIFEGFGEKF